MRTPGSFVEKSLAFLVTRRQLLVRAVAHTIASGSRIRNFVGMEIKAAATVADADFRGLHSFAAMAGKRLRAGIVLYAGRETPPFGDRMWAVPLEALWAEGR
jgi:hypothetical protein